MVKTAQGPTHELPMLNCIAEELVPRFDPEYVRYYNKYNVGRLATHQVPIESYRKDPLRYTVSYGRELVDAGAIAVSEVPVPVAGATITVRVFQPPPGAAAGPGPRPAYINYHGGGWVFGGLGTDFDFCKRVVHQLGCVAFDVDYRLAPEHKFPVPVDDAWAAYQWIHAHAATYNVDVQRLAVGGCSAGGHLSAVVAHLCRDAGLPLALQLLGVPVCDLRMFDAETSLLRDDCAYPSYREMYHTQPLPTERMEWFHGKFLGLPRAPALAEVSPICAPSFAGLAPALVITAEMDVLRDEGEAYAAKMTAAGSKARLVRVDGAPHTFMQLDGILEIGQVYNREALAGLADAFGVTVRPLEAA